MFAGFLTARHAEVYARYARFFATKALGRKVFCLVVIRGTVRIVSLSEVEDQARSSAIKIANLCRVTCVVFDFAQTDKL
ncbi:hypothetical protein SAMN05216297_107254 [Flavobacterium phragmitis]|uniref:Uncharacterized protein n=1 Tax=Flavobacterium phragmitis TaxID=739143 RepID=A0A1I1RZU8_9FLAO|nr:hypothetical protein SAMN05216297_107254 [Flavobacterium phragmitis]